MTITRPPVYSIIATVSGAFPGIVKHLTGRARWVAISAKSLSEMQEYGIKTEAQYLSRLTEFVRRLYDGEDTKNQFLDNLDAIMSRQIFLAHLEAWKDNGGDKNNFPDYLQSSADDMILKEYDFADGFANDIIDARLDNAPIDPLLARAEMWASRYNDAYNTAQLLIAEQQGEATGKPVKLLWRLGATEEHCEICSTLDGVIALASVWREANIFPQSGQDGNLPNPALVAHRDGQSGCGGWRCDCGLSQTDDEITVESADELRALIGWE